MADDKDIVLKRMGGYLESIIDASPELKERVITLGRKDVGGSALSIDETTELSKSISTSLFEDPQFKKMSEGAPENRRKLIGEVLACLYDSSSPRISKEAKDIANELLGYTLAHGAKLDQQLVEDTKDKIEVTKLKKDYIVVWREEGKKPKEFLISYSPNLRYPADAIRDHLVDLKFPTGLEVNTKLSELAARAVVSKIENKEFALAVNTGTARRATTGGEAQF